MKSVVYNPNLIDSIFAAVILQTYGWKAYAANEVIDVAEGKFYWVGLLPTHKHFPFLYKQTPSDRLLKVYLKLRDKVQGFLKGKPKAEEPKATHTCFVKTARARTAQHIVLKDVSYGLATINRAHKDAYLRIDHSASILEQVCEAEKINSNEVHFLNYLIDDFYRPNQTVESLAMAVSNVVAALEALRTGEVFTPIRMSEDRMLKPELVKAMAQLKVLQDKAHRVLNLGASFQMTSTSSNGKSEQSRVVRTYESNDWWFIRRYLQKNDIGLNTVVSATGSLIDATVDFNSEHPVQDPIVIVS